MENTDWDSVLQYVTEPIDMDFMNLSEKPVAGRTVSLTIPSQVPTPPDSFTGSPVDSTPEENTLVSVSTTFFPGAQNNPLPSDLVVLSSDSVFFYVHTHVLLGASDNGFNSLLPHSQKDKNPQLGAVIGVRESSTVLNILFHTIYDMSCSHYSPSFDALADSVTALKTYGISVQTLIAPSTPLYALLLSHAPLCPLELYALAASCDLYELATATSSHLLSFSLATLTDGMSERIGPKYLKRLFFLHFGRADALKRLLLPPPAPHAPTLQCDFTEQKRLTRAWALASAYLAWDARPDLSTSILESALSPLGEHLTCEFCRNALQDRVKDLVIQWSMVKRTI